MNKENELSLTMATENDEATIDQLTNQWFEGWSTRDTPFTGEQLRSLYAQGDREILVFDNFNGGVVVIRSFSDYLNTWIPVMQDFSYWAIAPESEVEVKASGDLATSTFTWSGEGKLRDGTPVKMRQHGTLVWQRRAGQWQIVHEHLTVGDVPRSS
jgi:ketosteroid isomerase-like protein